MKKITKISLIIIALLLIMSVLAGCSILSSLFQDSPAQDDIQINNGESIDEDVIDGANEDKVDDLDDNGGYDFDDYGKPVIEIYLSGITVDIDGIYNTMNEVAAYIYLYHKLPSNYKPKGVFSSRDYTKDNKLSCGGDKFYNREGLLPEAKGRTYTECDIGYSGGTRNSLRIVYSSDWLIFYTSDHYASYSIIKIIED